MTQNNLGLRSRGWASGRGARRGARRLAEAVEAYRQALAVCTRDDLPQDWAATQDNLGPRSGAGRAAGGRGGARRLAEAVEACRQALAVYTRDDLPQHWAKTQDNLGLALRRLGERRGAPEGRGGWPRRSRPSARPSPSTPATTSPRTGPRPRTTWATRSRFRSVWTVSRKDANRSIGSHGPRASATTRSPRRRCGRSPSSAKSPRIKTPRQAAPSRA